MLVRRRITNLDAAAQLELFRQCMGGHAVRVVPILAENASVIAARDHTDATEVDIVLVRLHQHLVIGNLHRAHRVVFGEARERSRTRDYA